MGQHDLREGGAGGPSIASVLEQIQLLQSQLAQLAGAQTATQQALFPRPGPAVPLADLRGRLLREVYVTPQRASETVRVMILAWDRVLAALPGVTVLELERRHGLAILETYRGTPALANTTLNALAAGCTWAERWGWHPGPNPCRGIRRYPVRRRKPTLTLEQYRNILRLLEAEQDPRAEAILFAGCTSLRRSEARLLRWVEVDLPGRCVHLAHSKTGARSVPISSDACAILRRQVRATQAKYVFARSGKPWLPSARGDALWQRIREAAGVPDLTVHELRHAWATTAARSGVPLYHVQRVLGHSSTWMTESYAHLALDDARLATEVVAAALRGDDAA